MHLQEELDLTAAYADLKSFENFRQHLDPRWIEMAIEESGTWTLRRRRLPAEQVVWLVIAMGLFRDRRIDELVDKLELALPGRGGAPMAPSAISDGTGAIGVAFRLLRTRLGNPKRGPTSLARSCGLRRRRHHPAGGRFGHESRVFRRADREARPERISSGAYRRVDGAAVASGRRGTARPLRQIRKRLRLRVVGFSPR